MFKQIFSENMLNHYNLSTKIDKDLSYMYILPEGQNKSQQSWDQQHLERLPDSSKYEVWTEFTAWETLITTMLMSGLQQAW